MKHSAEFAGTILQQQQQKKLLIRQTRSQKVSKKESILIVLPRGQQWNVKYLKNSTK